MLPAAIWAALILACGSQDNVFYVAADGSDSNPGTESRPWQTIQKAAATLTAGQTVQVKEGVYNERVVPENSGSEADGEIVYEAYPGDEVLIDGNGIAVPDDEGLVYIFNKSHIRFSGFHVDNAGYAGIMVSDADHVRIIDNHVTKSASSGIGVWGCNFVTVDSNEVELACANGMQEFLTVANTDSFVVANNHVHNGAAGVDKEGICIKDGASRGRVYGNTVDHVEATGLYVDAYDKQTGDIEVFQNVIHDVAGEGLTVATEMGGFLENVALYNNLIYQNKTVGIYISSYNPAVPDHPIVNLTIYNNTIYDNGWSTWGGCIVVDNSDVEEAVIRNNICSRGFTFQILVGDSVPMTELTVDHNLIDGFHNEPGEIYGHDSVIGDPRFVDGAAGDFYLQANSPAIDAGTADGAPVTDFAGTVRPQSSGFDIGAYERLAP